MKTLLATLFIVSIFPLNAHAKLQVFTSEDAAKFVMTNTDVLAMAKKSSGADTFLGLKVEAADKNEFDVKLELAKLDYRCIVNVGLSPRTEVVSIPSGGRITINKLSVRDVRTERCE